MSGVNNDETEFNSAAKIALKVFFGRSDELDLFKTAVHLHLMGQLTEDECRQLLNEAQTQAARTDYLLNTVLPSKAGHHMGGMQLLKKALEESKQVELLEVLDQAYEDALGDPKLSVNRLNIRYEKELSDRPENDHRYSNNYSEEIVKCWIQQAGFKDADSDDTLADEELYHAQVPAHVTAHNDTVAHDIQNRSQLSGASGLEPDIKLPIDQYHKADTSTEELTYHRPRSNLTTYKESPTLKHKERLVSKHKERLVSKHKESPVAKRKASMVFYSRQSPLLVDDDSLDEEIPCIVKQVTPKIEREMNDDVMVTNDSPVVETVPQSDTPFMKFIVVGDRGTGKTSLLHRYVRNTFSLHTPTVLLDVYHQEVNMPAHNISYTLQLWDTAGQERFRSLTSAYYRDAVGGLVVYDVTNKESLRNCVQWKREIDEVVAFSNDDLIPVVLVANKVDLGHFDGEQFSKDHGFTHYFETSAKTGKGVKDAMHFLVEKVAN